MVKEAKKERKYQRIMPAMGFIIAVTLGVVAYFVAPEFLVFMRTDGPSHASINERLSDMSASEYQLMEYATMVFIWLVLFGAAMLIVAVAIGEDPREEEMILRPKEKATPKEVKQYLKKVKKMESRRLKQAEAKRKADERAAKRRG